MPGAFCFTNKEGENNLPRYVFFQSLIHRNCTYTCSSSKCNSGSSAFILARNAAVDFTFTFLAFPKLHHLSSFTSGCFSFQTWVIIQVVKLITYFKKEEGRVNVPPCVLHQYTFVYQNAYCRLGEACLRFIRVFQNFVGTSTRRALELEDTSSFFSQELTFKCKCLPFFD